MSSIGRLSLTILVMSCALAGCVSRSGPAMPMGSRQLVITVANASQLPIPLEVARSGFGRKIGTPVGEAVWVGIVQPSMMPPGTTQQVVFVVPPSADWAIYANGGELFGPADIRGMGAVLPVGIQIHSTGDPSSGPWP